MLVNSESSPQVPFAATLYVMFALLAGGVRELRALPSAEALRWQACIQSGMSALPGPFVLAARRPLLPSRLAFPAPISTPHRLAGPSGATLLSTIITIVGFFEEEWAGAGFALSGLQRRLDLVGDMVLGVIWPLASARADL